MIKISLMKSGGSEKDKNSPGKNFSYTVLVTYMSLRDNLFIEPDESINGSLSDLQGGR